MLISVHPFVGLFREMVRILAPAFFAMGQPILETACQTIAAWCEPGSASSACRHEQGADRPVRGCGARAGGGTRPAPRLGRTYELPFMGSVLHVTLPAQHGSQWDDTFVSQTPTDMGVANDVRRSLRRCTKDQHGSLCSCAITGLNVL